MLGRCSQRRRTTLPGELRGAVQVPMCIPDAALFLAEFPVSGAEILPGIRKHVLQKFRYSLIYTVEEDCLLILAVAHHSRRPGYWVGRASRRSRGHQT